MHKLFNFILAASASVLAVVPAFGQAQQGSPYWQQSQQQMQPYYVQNGYAPQQQRYYGNVSTANQSQIQPSQNYTSGQLPAQPLLNSSRSNSAGSQYSPFQGSVPEVAKHTGFLSGVGHLIGNTVRVAAPVAGGLMMMKASSNMMQNSTMPATALRTSSGTILQPAVTSTGQQVMMNMPMSTPMTVYPSYGYTNPSSAMMAPMMMGAGMSMMMNANR